MPKPHDEWVSRWHEVQQLITPDPFPPDTPSYARVIQLLNALDFHYGNLPGQAPRPGNMPAFDSTLTVLRQLCASAITEATTPE